ncbi:hypothetical protein L0128_12315 [candidate division KSB1 bacterium]|nr:hypothetical protein [candidate division KSB1 bacterium]
MSYRRIVRIEAMLPRSSARTRRIIFLSRYPAADSPDQVSAGALLQRSFYLHLSLNFIKLLSVIYAKNEPHRSCTDDDG